MHFGQTDLHHLKSTRLQDLEKAVRSDVPFGTPEESAARAQVAAVKRGSQVKERNCFEKKGTANTAKQEEGWWPHHLGVNYVNSPCEIRAMTRDAGEI